MDLQKGIPLTILAAVAVLAIVGMVMMYNSETTGWAVQKSYSISKITAPKRTRGLTPAWGQAVAAVKPRRDCYILNTKGALYDADDVGIYITEEQINNLQTCYPYFSLDETQAKGKRCCVGI
jgi:hypothetical protein